MDNLKDTFILETENKSVECRIITSIYKEKRNKHYLIYEYVDNLTGDIFVSSYDPKDINSSLLDVTDEELNELASDLEELSKYE